MNHPLDGKCFTVTILDPNTEKPKHKLYFFWNLPKNIAKSLKSGEPTDEAKKYVRGGFEFDFENIDESKLKLTEDKVELVSLDKKNYFTQVSVYPEDSFWTLRQKIYLCTGIPIYRQHLFVKQGEIHKTGYNIILQESEYPVSRAKDTNKIMGVNIDLLLYSNREFLQIRTEETYTLLDKYIDEKFYMYDLNDYMSNFNYQELLNDTYQFNVIYYSVIKKYFPVMDDAMFRLHLMDENKVIAMYPLLNQPKSYLESRFTAENKILTDVYQNYEKYKKKFSPNILMEINHIEIVCNSFGNSLAIRNLIDIMKMSSECIAIDAYISNGQSKYRVIKHWLGLEQYILQQILDAEEDYYGKDFMVIYLFDGLETHNLYIYNDGSYKLVGLFSHSHDITFDNVIERTEKLVQPIIDLVNKNTKYLFSKLQKYVAQNLEFQKINIKLKWDMQYTELQFSQLMNILTEYYTSGIIEQRNINPRPNTFMTKIVKGISKNNVRLYLKKGAETKDYYIIFKDQKINETWNNRYSGENMEISNTLVNVVFELHGMTVEKFNRASAYIFQLINNMNENINKEEKRKISIKSSKKKKFKDIDPELYDFEDNKGTKYARICQKKHRPIDILTEAQYNNLKENEKKYIFPFINYTTGEPVYYKCSDKLPYAGFIVNKHPKGYCVPKCKESNTNGLKNKQIWELCMNKRKVEKGELETKTHNDNILKFGKFIEEGKYGHMHDTVLSILDVDRDEFLLVGYPQYFTEVNGGHVLDILAHQLEVNPVNIIDKIISDLTIDVWNTVLSANMGLEDFVRLLHKFRDNDSENQLNWADVFIELASHIFGVHVIIFETVITQAAELLTRNNSSINIKYTDLTKFTVVAKNPIKMCLVVELYGNYYPINMVNYDESTKLFDQLTKVNKRICKIISKLESNILSPYSAFEYLNLLKVVEVKRKYVWQQRINYVELSNGAIIGCYNSVNFTDGREENHTMVDIKKNNSKFADVAEVLSKLSKDVPQMLCFNKSLHKVESCKDCQFIGCRVGPIICWFNPISCDEVSKIYPKFDIELVGYDITDVNNAIIQNKPPLKIHMNGINQTYYKAYIYKIFKYEFYKILLLYKKSQNKFVKKYKDNELTGYIQANKDYYKYSYAQVVQILKYSENTEKDLKNMVVYEDLFELRKRLASMTISQLKNIVSKYVVEVDKIDDISIENVIYSPITFTKLVANDKEFTYEFEINDDKETLFYKNRLKVTNLPEMVKLLKQDLSNELLFIYEITDFQLMFIINYLNFHNYDDEKIIIQSL